MLPGQDRQALDQQAVLVQQRHDVGHGSQGHQVQTLLQVRVFAAEAVLPSVLEERVADFERDPDAGEVLDLGWRARQFGVDDRVGIDRRVPWHVMVRDDDVQTSLARRTNGLVAGDAAVDGQQKTAVVGAGFLDRLGGQAVAVIDAVRQVALRVGAVTAEYPGGQGGSGDAVGIVVAMHKDAFALQDGLPEPFSGLACPRERERVTQMLQRRAQESIGARRRDTARGKNECGRPGHTGRLHQFLYTRCFTSCHIPDVFIHGLVGSLVSSHVIHYRQTSATVMVLPPRFFAGRALPASTFRAMPPMP